MGFDLRLLLLLVPAFAALIAQRRVRVEFGRWFALVTLPVEVQASRHAVDALEANGIVTTAELPGVRRVLRAAAFTYAAGLAQRLGVMLFLVAGVAIARG